MWYLRDVLCSVWGGTGDNLHELSKLWSLHATTGADEGKTSGDRGESAPCGDVTGQSQDAVLGNPILTFL